MTRAASARTTTRGTLRPVAAGLVAVAAAIAGTLVYQSATSPARPGTAQPVPVTPRNGPLGTIAWPASGVSAAGISGIGVLPGPGASRPVPIASVAKVMTAYIILRDHPLGAGEPGPAIVVRPGEAAAYPAQARNGDSLVPVIAGERLTERQALEALLLPSADNMAWILARWDAGSQAAFTAQMNTTARRLGMTDTHYTDPSGLSASTTSTAADQVRLGMAAMRERALAQIVALRSAVIPVAGVVRNYNTLLGQDGITGLKTGSDTAAGGCVLLAARRQARGHHILIVAATFGQPGAMATMLPTALQAGRHLVLAVGHALAGMRKRSAGGQLCFRNGHYLRGMDEFRARRVADALRDRGVNAHLLRGGLGQFGVRVSLPGGREAEWDTDGTAGLEAQVMRDGMLVGYVPQIEGSEDFSERQIVDAIARTDYDQPIARQRAAAPAPGPALSREGGVFRRFLDGFRYR